MHAILGDWESPLPLHAARPRLATFGFRGLPRTGLCAVLMERADAPTVLVATQPRSASSLRPHNANRIGSFTRAVDYSLSGSRPYGEKPPKNMVTEVGSERSVDRDDLATYPVLGNATQKFCGAMGARLRPCADILRLPSLMMHANEPTSPHTSKEKVTRNATPKTPAMQTECGVLRTPQDTELGTRVSQDARTRTLRPYRSVGW